MSELPHPLMIPQFPSPLELAMDSKSNGPGQPSEWDTNSEAFPPPSKSDYDANSESEVPYTADLPPNCGGRL